MIATTTVISWAIQLRAIFGLICSKVWHNAWFNFCNIRCGQWILSPIPMQVPEVVASKQPHKPPCGGMRCEMTMVALGIIWNENLSTNGNTLRKTVRPSSWDGTPRREHDMLWFVNTFIRGLRDFLFWVKNRFSSENESRPPWPKPGFTDHHRTPPPDRDRIVPENDET